MSGHDRQTAAARQEGQSMAESNTVSAKEPQCGCCLWESRWQRVPLDEGQASLGEALVTVHTCRLLLQPRRRFIKFRVLHVIIAPEGKDNPRWSRFPMFFKHNIQHKVIAKDFALQIILFTLAYSEKTQ